MIGFRVLVTMEQTYQNGLRQWLTLSVGESSKKHESGMRSFDVQCTSYNKELTGKQKLTEFLLRCFFDTGKRWEGYEPPCSGILDHIVGQLVGRYSDGDDQKPAVLITDFKALSLLEKEQGSFGSNTTDPEKTTPTKRKYGPKSSKLLSSPLTTPEKPRGTLAVTSGRGSEDTIGLSPPVSMKAPEQTVAYSEEAKGENEAEIASQRKRFRRAIETSVVRPLRRR